MNSYYKVGMSALILAIFSGLSGGIAALFYQINQFLFISHDGLSSNFLINLVHTHARMMIFYTLQPALMIAFGSWFVPVMIGAKNFSFPFINIISIILLGFGFVCNLLTFFYSQTALLTLGSLALWAIASVLFSINMLVTIINNRGVNVSFVTMPLFVWLQAIGTMLLLGASSVLLAALTRDYWNYALHLNWAIDQTVQNFAFPMVMILSLPAFGIIFHSLYIVAECSLDVNKKLLAIMVGIPLLIFLFWNKLIFNGNFWNFNDDKTIKTIFSIGLYLFILSLGFYAVKLFMNGKRTVLTPILWSFGSVFLFVFAWPYTGLIAAIGQIHSGITYAVLFAVFAGFYLWMGKIFGKQYNETLGKLHFYITMIGAILTLNILSIGKNTALIADLFMGFSILTFVWVILNAYYNRTRPIANYWGGKVVTNEWKLPSPMYFTK